MARKTYNTGILITGNAKGGVQAVKLTSEELKKLNATQKRGTGYAKKYAASQKGVMSSVQGIAKVALAAGAALGAFSFARQISESIDYADKIQKLSIRLGTSTEALSEYRFVAEQSGVTFDSLAIAWQRQTRRLAEAAAGSGEAKKALAELGLSAKELKDLKPEQQFEVLAEALNGVESEADRVRLAMKFWDSEGVALLQVVDAGTEGIRAMREESVKTGNSLSRDQVNAAAAAKNAIGQLSLAYRGTAQTLAIEFAPAIAETLDLFNKVAGEEGIARAALITFGKVVSGVVDDISIALNRKLGDAAFNMAQRLALLGEQTNWSWAKEQARALSDMGVELHKSAAATERLQIATEKERKAALAANTQVKKYVPVARQYAAETKKAADTTDKHADAIASVTQGLVQQYIKLKDGERAAYEYSLTMQGFTQAEIEAALAIWDANKAMRGQQAAAKELGKVSAEEASVFGEVWKNAVDSVDGIFRDLWRGAFDGATSFGENLKNWFKNLLAELAHAAITRPIVLSLGAMFGAGAPGSALAGGSVFGGGGVGDLFGNFLSSTLGAGGLLGASGSFFGSIGLGSFGAGLIGAGGGIGSALATAGAGFAGGGIGMTIGAVLPFLLPLIPLIGGLFKDEEAKTKYKLSSRPDWVASGGGIDTIKTVGNTTTGYRKGDPTRVQVDTVFGSLGAGIQHTGKEGQLSDEEAAQFLQNAAQYYQGFALVDESLAALLSEDKISAVAEAMVAFEQDLSKTKNLDLESFVRDRYTHVFDAIGGQMDAVYDTMIAKSSGVEIGQIVSQVASFFEVLDAHQNLAANYADAVDAANDTLFDAAAKQRDSLFELIAAYDGSYEANQQLTQGLAQRYQLELQMLAQIDSVAGSINASFAKSIEQIKLSQMTEAQKYDYLTDRAEALAAGLAGMSDPAEIQATMDQINSLALQAWNALDPSQQAANSGGFISFFEDVLNEAQTQLDKARENIGDENEAFQNAIGDQVVASMQTAADTQQTAAQTMSQAAENMNNATLTLADFINKFGGFVQDMPQDIHVLLDGLPDNLNYEVG